MNLACAFVCLVLVLWPPSVRAVSCDDSPACLREVAAAQSRVRSMSARFVQTKHVSLLAEPIETTGTFTYEHPDHIVWRGDDPPFELRLDGGEIQLPAGEETSLRAAAPALSGLLTSMSAMFTGDADRVLAAFDVDARQEGEGIVVRLTPKAAQHHRIIESIRLSFAEPDLVLRRIHIEEGLGDSLDVVLSDTRRALADK